MSELSYGQEFKERLKKYYNEKINSEGIEEIRRVDNIIQKSKNDINGSEKDDNEDEEIIQM